MSTGKKTLPVLGLLACLLLASAVAAAPTATTVDRWVIGGGGGRVISPAYTLDATVGQPVAGLSLYPGGQLCSGFWCGASAGSRVFLPIVLRDSTATSE